MSSSLILEQYISMLMQVGIPVQSMLNSFSQITLQRGISYFEEDRVILHNIEPDFNDDIRIEAEVEGSAGQSYNIEVTITLIREHISIIGVCDCPVGFRCKHAVAAILEFARSYNEFQSDDEPFNDLSAAQNEEQQVEHWLNNLKP